MTAPVRVKLCGLRSATDVAAAVAAGADAVGFVTGSPLSSRDLPLDAVRTFARALPPFVSSVAVTASDDPDTLSRIVDVCRPDFIQVPGAVGIDVLDDRRKRSEVRVLRAMRPAGDDPVADALDLFAHSDGIVLDAMHTLYGGTGERLDTPFAARMIAELDPRPVLLAGGLTPENVADAVREVRPFAVDVSSGIETGGIKDRARMRAFVTAAKEALLHV